MAQYKERNFIDLPGVVGYFKFLNFCISNFKVVEYTFYHLPSYKFSICLQVICCHNKEISFCYYCYFNFATKFVVQP